MPPCHHDQERRPCSKLGFGIRLRVVEVGTHMRSWPQKSMLATGGGASAAAAAATPKSITKRSWATTRLQLVLMKRWLPPFLRVPITAKG